MTQHGRSDADQVQDVIAQDFYSVAQPCVAIVRNQHRARTVADGLDCNRH